MGYLALYRKYRPTTFDEVIGQDHITKTLINQINSDMVGHAYLFTGSRGTGKTSTAKIFAKAINCENTKNGSPCGKCEACKTMLQGGNLDILEIDAASNNGVDEIRELREQVTYPPVVGKYKVYIIDEVHMLSTSAFNALLKTLEEPPKYVVFILATTEVHKIPATILSRCMRFDFKLVSTDEITKLISKILDGLKIQYDEKAVGLIARAGNGSVRDALSIADMVISYSNNKLSYDSVVQVVGNVEKEKLFNIVDKILKNDIGNMLAELDLCFNSGKSAGVLAKEIISYFRDLLVILTLPEEKSKELVVVPQDVFDKMKGQATQDNYIKIISAIENLSSVEQDLRYSVHPSIVLETALIKTMNFINLEERVANIEKQLQDGNLEVKKKIRTDELVFKDENINPIHSSENIVGRLLSYMRINGYMIVYAGLSETKSIKLNGNNLDIQLIRGTGAEQLMEESNRKAIEKFANEYGYNLSISIVESDENLLIEKLRASIGEKLEIR